MRTVVMIVVVALVGACARTPTMVRYADEGAGRVVIRDVRVLTAGPAGTVEHQDVWIAAGSIERVVPTDSAPAPGDARVVDGTGKTLLPGLIDVHVHATGTEAPPWDMGLPDPRANLQRFLYAGLTTVIDLGGPLGRLRSLKQDIDNGEFAGPDMRYCGPVVGAAHGHPAALIDVYVPWPFKGLIRRQLSFQVQSLADIDDAVAAVRDGGGFMVKIAVDHIPLDAPTLDQDMVNHAVKVAHAAGLRVAAHVGSNADAIAAVNAGVDLLVHNVYREPLARETAELLASAQVPVAPTIGVFHSFDVLAHEGLEDVPLLHDVVAPDVIAQLRDRPADAIPAPLQSWVDAVHAQRQQRFANARMLREAGVKLLVGSDSAVSAWPAGAALHRELEHLVAAGYSPTEVLIAATRHNAETMGLNDRGTVAAGQRADLLLVDGDPTQDIRDVHRIAAVYRAGREVTRTPPFAVP